MNTYVVQPGDSLSLISKRFYGDFSKVKELQELNKIANADIIHPGQKLILPDGAAQVVDAEEVDENGNAIGWKSTLGKWFPWLLVIAAAAVLSYEASKEKKKSSAAKSGAAPKAKTSSLSGNKGPRKQKKKFHAAKPVKVGDWTARYNSHWKKYQATHEGGAREEFKTIAEAKKFIKRHG